VLQHCGRPADTGPTPALRRTFLIVLIAILGTAVTSSARAASDVVIPEGGFADVAFDPISGRSVGISSDTAPGSVAGHMTMRLYATALDVSGRPTGGPRMFAPIWSPDLMGPHPISVATDTRRGRHLVAYTASKPGMGVSPCAPLPPVAPEVAGMAAWLFGDQTSCTVTDGEVFVRLLDRAGRAIGPERQVSSVGPPASGVYRSGAPSIAYDAPADAFVVVFNAFITEDQQASAVLTQKLRADGRPVGAPRALALEPEPVTTAPQTSLVANPRGGYLLVYTSGPLGRKALYARRIASDGALAGATTVLTGTGIGGFELDVDRRSRRVLVAYTRGGGIDSDIRARLVNLAGRPIGEIVDLPYRIGAGGVYVAASGSGSWLYGFSRRGEGLESQAFVQSADSRGRPNTPVRPLSPTSGVNSGSPLLMTTRGGGVLVRWGETPIVCTAGSYGEDSCTLPETGALHLRVMRP
jgi:hypothetical protein